VKSTTKRAIISLDLVHLDAPGLVSFTRAIAKGLTGNPNITAANVAKLPVAIADLQTAAQTLETTHVARLTAPSKAATKLEHDQANTLMQQITNTATFIQGLANTTAAGDVNLADSIIASVGFQLKKTGVKRRKVFSATSPAKGTAHVYVPSGKRTAVRLLQYSADGGKTYCPTIVVHGVDVIVTALKSGVDYLFQMAMSAPPAKKAKLTITAGSEAAAWSDPISCVIS